MKTRVTVESKRVTQDTPDPDWAKNLRLRLQEHLSLLVDGTPFIWTVRKGPGALNREEMRRFMLVVGKDIIQQFPLWLKFMGRKSVVKGGSLDLFLRANRLQELLHWRWWQLWGTAYGLTYNDFVRAEQDETVFDLSVHLERLALVGNLAHAVAAINLVIENLSAELSAIVDAGIGSSLSEEQRRWLVEHAGGDPIHGADAWELLKQQVAADPAFDFEELKKVVDRTALLFTLAIRSAYRKCPGETLSQERCTAS